MKFAKFLNRAPDNMTIGAFKRHIYKEFLLPHQEILIVDITTGNEIPDNEFIGIWRNRLGSKRSGNLK